MEKYFSAAMFDELEPLYPDTCIKSGVQTSYQSAASGTFPAIHILLNDLTPGQPVTVEAFGPNKSYKFFTMLPVPVEYNTGCADRTELLDNSYNTNVIRRAPFMIYEAYKPFINIFTPQFETAALCFRVKLTNEKFEKQKWTILINHKNVTKKLEFVIEAFPAKVPKAGKDTHKYVNWIAYNAVASYHGVEKWSPAYLKILKKYYEVAAYTRQNMVCFWPDEIFEVVDGKPVLHEKHLDTMVKLATDVGFYYLSSGSLCERWKGDWGATEAQTRLTYQKIPGDGEDTLASMCRQIYEYVTKNNLQERWLQSFFDEPLDCSANVFRLGTDIIKANMPGIPILEATAATTSIEGTVDIWCPTVNEFEKYLEFFARRKSLGDRLFVYTCLQPANNFCNRLLDMERLRQVYLGWAPAKYKDIEGFLHWGGTAPYDDVNAYEMSLRHTENTFLFEPTPSNVLPAGDHIIFYPGFNTAYSSTRAEAHRIGLEDLCLLEKLAAFDEKLASNFVEKLFRSYRDYEKQVSVYREVKTELLRAVSKI